MAKRRPNFLFLMVDEQRYPPVYEGRELRRWREQYLTAQTSLARRGLTFENHYAGATACSPSRTTLFTGQYPSLHGVTGTTGAAKEAFDSNTYWLDAASVPTMGAYFRAAGYKTIYKGKWHISDEDILVPGTKTAVLSYDAATGVPDPEREEQYLRANRLDRFGWDGWLGPEPHGSAPHNSGSSAAIGVPGRDRIYAREAAAAIRALEREAERGRDEPWLLVASFVNPHDIVLYGEIAKRSPEFDFSVDRSVPSVPRSPTASESLETKPGVQASYRDLYARIFQPLRDTETFRRLYYSLHLEADRNLRIVLEALDRSGFADDTIIIFTSDHGDLLGAHGGLFQKWYVAYEEAIHVPLVISHPRLTPRAASTRMLTSHVDVLPTMLGLAGIDADHVQRRLAHDHTEVHPLVGRDLSPLVTGRGRVERPDEPIYFMSDDDVSKGQHQVNILGLPYPSVDQPSHLETVIAVLPGPGRGQTYKYTRYFDNPQFWSDPGVSDTVTREIGPGVHAGGDKTVGLYVTHTKTQPVPDQFELYNLTDDPLEEHNLAHPDYRTSKIDLILSIMARLLEQQCEQKRLRPGSGSVPGMPVCGPAGGGGGD